MYKGFMKFVLVISLLIGSVIFADEGVKNQIENLLKGQNLSTQGKSGFNHSFSPRGLEQEVVWTHLQAPVSQIILQKTSNVTVTAYVCEPYKRYWHRVQGTVLNLDLWYGHFQYSYSNNSPTFFQNQFRNHSRQLPSLQPNQLQQTTHYRTTDYGNVVTKYDHGRIYPGYKAFSYYCNRGNRYWVELRETRSQKSYWYGPYPYQAPQPPAQLKVVIELDKPQYDVSETPSIRISVQNNSPRNVWLQFNSGMRGDYVIDNVYRWSSGRFFTQVLSRELIPAYGKKQIFQQLHSAKDYRLTPGKHTIFALVKTSNRGLLRSQEITFSVRRSFVPPTNPSSKVLMQKAIDMMRKGKYNIARKILIEIAKTEPRNIVAHYNLACVEAVTYNEDLALDYLSRALELGYKDFSHIRQDPDLNNIRHLRRFRKLLKKYQYNRGY